MSWKGLFYFKQIKSTYEHWVSATQQLSNDNVTLHFRVLSMSCLSDLMNVNLDSTVKCPPLQLILASSGHQSGTEALSVTVVSSEDLSVNTSLA